MLFWGFYGLSEANTWPADTNESTKSAPAAVLKAASRSACCCSPLCSLPIFPSREQLSTASPLQPREAAVSLYSAFSISSWPVGVFLPVLPACAHLSPLLPLCRRRAGLSTGRGQLLLRASRAVVPFASEEQIARRLAAVSVLRRWPAFPLPQLISSSDCAFVSSAPTLHVQFFC